jgi:hypothetical protein
MDADLNPEIVISARGSYILYIDANMNISLVNIQNKSDTLELLDYDNDGYLDLVEMDVNDECSTPTTSDELRYWINNGDGSFSEEVVSYVNPNVEIDIPEQYCEIEVSEDDQGGIDKNQEKSGGGSVGFLFIFILMGVLFQNWKFYRDRRL